MKALRHPTSDELLRHLEGECDAAEQKWIGNHLLQCWKCRTHATELQARIHAFTSALQGEPWPSAEHHELAQRRLQTLLRNDAAARGLRSRPWHSQLGSFFLRLATTPQRWVWATSSIAILLVAAIGLRQLHPATEEQRISNIPHEAETSLAIGFTQWDLSAQARRPAEASMHGTAQIRIADRAQPGRVERANVEWIDDAANGWLAARWKENRGTIRLASWRSATDGDVAYVYRRRHWSTATNGLRTPVAITETAATLTANQLEEALFFWVRDVARTPSGASLRLASLGARPGSVVRSRSEGSSTWTCISARERESWVEDCLRYDTRTAVVLQEIIRLFSADYDLRIQIPWHSVREVSEPRAMLASFLPPGLDRVDKEYARRDIRRPRFPSPPKLEPPKPDLLSALLSADEALETLSVIGGPGMVLDASRESEGIRVSGRVSSREQLALIESSVGHAVPGDLLRLDVKVGDEAPLPPPREEPDTGATASEEPAALPLVRRARPGLSKEARREFCNRAVTLAGRIVAESTAIENLARRYGPEVESELGIAGAARLDRLRHARMQRLRSDVGVLQAHLKDIVPLSEATAVEAIAPPDGAAYWQATSRHLAAAARRLHADVIANFAVNPRSSAPAPSIASLWWHLDLLAKAAQDERALRPGEEARRNP